MMERQMSAPMGINMATGMAEPMNKRTGSISQAMDKTSDALENGFRRSIAVITLLQEDIKDMCAILNTSDVSEI